MYSVPKNIDDMSWIRMEWLSFSRDIAANTTGNGPVGISDNGDFHCKYLGGQYTTQVAGPADGGACLVSIQITDNGKRWQIFDNLVPMSLFANPGRQRVSGVAGDPSNPLFYPIEFPYIFTSGTSIRIDFANASAFANNFWLVFYGERHFHSKKS
jgi:hypothetical protein